MSASNTSIRNWNAAEYFDPVDVAMHPVVEEARDYLKEKSIDEHPFFSFAAKNRSALQVWTSQEAVVTNPFSQMLLRVASEINNVHLRTLLLPVISGEHSRFRDGMAQNSHPWMLLQLYKSLGLDVESLAPLPFTDTFASSYHQTENTLLYSLGVLGVGNERMIVVEYSAIKKCFETVARDSEFSGFIDANIGEDLVHCEIVDQVASGLIRLTKGSARDYLKGAMAGVDARIKYYNNLLAYCERINQTD